MTRHFISLLDLTKSEANAMLRRAKEMKNTDYRSDLLAGKTIVLLFEKASTRTRLSFEVAVYHFGGKPIFMTPGESQLGRSEPLKDTARTISRFNDGLIMRTFGQTKLEQMMEFGTIPVINALTDEGHPCQLMSDMLTIYERTPDLENIEVAWVGDGNNLANSWIEAAIQFPITLRLSCPEGYDPDMNLFEKAKSMGAKVSLHRKPEDSVKGAHYINTDVWASMGQEGEKLERERAFAGYCIDARLMQMAAPSACFMHCLPAHRGEEVTEEVFESPASIVFDQAENRLHMQKAIIEWVYS